MQNALIINQKLADFTLETRPIPQVAAGEVLVKVKAVGLNPIDWKIQKYAFAPIQYPAILGSDIAGEVVAIGEGVRRYVVGDRVFGAGFPYPDYAGYQEYCKLKEDFSAKIPESLTYEQASTIPVTLATAHQGLYNVAPYGMGFTPLLPPGKNQHALVIGGGSSIGQFVIQLARESGFSPIITTASLKHTERLKSLGVTHVIDRTLPPDNLKTTIAEILVLGKSRDGLKYIFDAISEQKTQTVAYDLLAPGGTLELVLPKQISNESEDKRVLITYGYPDAAHNTVNLKRLYGALPSLIEEGTLKQTNVEVVSGGLGGIVEALGRLENNQASGFKFVARPSDK
ncbi:hypothetical protein AN958_05869 [Leucoagaricus sp. SymC.cos]|nr:hypothetical protein AN958_05869 [Leucoagaricus sp. SymC.cos]